MQSVSFCTTKQVLSRVKKAYRTYVFFFSFSFLVLEMKSRALPMQALYHSLSPEKK